MKPLPARKSTGRRRSSRKKKYNKTVMSNNLLNALAPASLFTSTRRKCSSENCAKRKKTEENCAKLRKTSVNVKLLALAAAAAENGCTPPTRREQRAERKTKKHTQLDSVPTLGVWGSIFNCSLRLDSVFHAANTPPSASSSSQS